MVDRKQHTFTLY